MKKTNINYTIQKDMLDNGSSNLNLDTSSISVNKNIAPLFNNPLKLKKNVILTGIAGENSADQNNSTKASLQTSSTLSSLINKSESKEKVLSEELEKSTAYATKLALFTNNLKKQKLILNKILSVAVKNNKFDFILFLSTYLKNEVNTNSGATTTYNLKLQLYNLIFLLKKNFSGALLENKEFYSYLTNKIANSKNKKVKMKYTRSDIFFKQASAERKNKVSAAKL